MPTNYDNETEVERLTRELKSMNSWVDGPEGSKAERKERDVLNQQLKDAKKRETPRGKAELAVRDAEAAYSAASSGDGYGAKWSEKPALDAAKTELAKVKREEKGQLDPRIIGEAASGSGYGAKGFEKDMRASLERRRKENLQATPAGQAELAFEQAKAVYQETSSGNGYGAKGAARDMVAAKEKLRSEKLMATRAGRAELAYEQAKAEYTEASRGNGYGAKEAAKAMEAAKETLRHERLMTTPKGQTQLVYEQASQQLNEALKDKDSPHVVTTSTQNSPHDTRDSILKALANGAKLNGSENIWASITLDDTKQLLQANDAAQKLHPSFVKEVLEKAKETHGSHEVKALAKKVQLTQKNLSSGCSIM